MANIVVETTSVQERKRILAEGVDLGTSPRYLWGEDPEVEPVWHPQEDEDGDWYNRFERFFLMVGPDRSVMGAYRLWKESRGEPLEPNLHVVSDHWRAQALIHQWRERATAYDAEVNRRIALKVEAASRRLRDAAPLAVEALIDALKNPKYSVSAAGQILDRAGLPAVTRQIVSSRVTYAAEDLERAREEVEEWEKQTQGASG